MNEEEEGEYEVSEMEEETQTESSEYESEEEMKESERSEHLDARQRQLVEMSAFANSYGRKDEVEMIFDNQYDEENLGRSLAQDSDGSDTLNTSNSSS